MKIEHFELNKITIDEFKRPNGILALNKPAGITSHDLVDEARKKLNTRKVGHTGTLDPFATGLMLVLVGKATKLSNQLLAENKTYEFDVLFGVSTDTQDPEGKVMNGKSIDKLDQNTLNIVLEKFQGKQLQVTPIFSSVKVDGIKLREYARGSDRYKIIKQKGKIVAICTIKEGSFLYKRLKTNEYTLELPLRDIEVQSIKLNRLMSIKPNEVPIQDSSITNDHKFMVANITAHVSKGTYIRQLAQDIGEKLGLPAMLISLNRTAIGKVTLHDIIELEELSAISDQQSAKPKVEK